MSKISKQRIDYRPSIGYISDYQTISEVGQQNITIGPQRDKEPLDTESIPSIESTINYLDTALKALPQDMYMAVREVYDPVREIFFDTLIDKIVDPNPQTPEIIIKPNDTDPKPDPNPEGPGDGDNEEDKDKVIHPIILYPIQFAPGSEEPTEPGPDDDDKKEDDDKVIYPIVLPPIEDSNSEDDDSNGDDNIKAPHPIVLFPMPGGYGDDNEDKPEPEPDDGEDDSDDEDEGLWEEPGIKVEYIYPDLPDIVEREFVYLFTKLLKHYLDKLKDIVNNYIYNHYRNLLGQSEENIKFINNKLELTSNDIMNHSKHLLDSSIKNEDLAALRVAFFKNNFNIMGTTTHLRSFLVSNEFRKRYTNIRYSRGNSIPNAASDAVLTKMNAKYELQFRRDFENLFRYLESSLKITDDVLRLYAQDGLNKSTIIKKGGIK